MSNALSTSAYVIGSTPVGMPPYTRAGASVFLSHGTKRRWPIAALGSAGVPHSFGTGFRHPCHVSAIYRCRLRSTALRLSAPLPLLCPH